jgi:tRNA (mo5U34)-methyltransferase
MVDVTDLAALRAAVDGQPLWYHTMELAPGVVTPGWFDLRPVVDRMPWPDVRGKRCLDIGTYDGFLAFELERRGAAEVIAVDIGSHEQWDFPFRDRVRGPAWLQEVAGKKGEGFEVAARALGSAVQRKFVSAYELDPAEMGTFDVVVCGSLLLHLRDPFGALERVREVCAGLFLSAEAIDLRLTTMHRRQPTLRLNGENGQWFVPSAAGHRRMLHVAGFDLVQATRPYAIPLGSAHPASAPSRGPRTSQLLTRLVTGGRGVPMSAALVRPVR